MSVKRKKIVDEPREVPGWIVSFSDMVTLLLAFFVLLQTFAHTRDPELFYAGQGSFKRAISGLGISNLMGGSPPQPLQNYRSLKYPTRKTETDTVRAAQVDERDERLRQMFRELRQSLSVKASDVKEQAVSVFNTPILFSRGSTTLDGRARQYLRGFARDLHQTVRRGKVKVHVVGLAADEKDSKGRFVLSAQRAEAVRRHLVQTLAAVSGEGWDVCSWGAGAGGQWSEGLGVASGKTHAAIAVISVEEAGP